jgi:hypothetical protein
MRNEDIIQSFKSNELKSHATIAKEEYGINFYEQSDEKEMYSVKEMLSNEYHIEQALSPQNQDSEIEDNLDDCYQA